MAKITKKVDNLGDHEFWFDNESWVRIKNVMSFKATPTMKRPILRVA